MKRIIFLVLLCQLLTFWSCENGLSERGTLPTAYNYGLAEVERTSVSEDSTSRSSYSYDSNGLVSHVYDYNEDGSIRSTTQYFYDEDHRVTRAEYSGFQTESSGSAPYTRTISYGDQVRCSIQIIYTTQFGFSIYRTEDTFDQYGRILQSSGFETHNGQIEAEVRKTIYEYSNSLLTKEYRYELNDQTESIELSSTTDYSYNDNGVLTTIIWDREDSELLCTDRISYNSSGYIESIESFTGDLLVSREEYTYGDLSLVKNLYTLDRSTMEYQLNTRTEYKFTAEGNSVFFESMVTPFMLASMRYYGRTDVQ